ncbi:hypothetical protein [Parachlamydia sp. AcF125]|uniref:hypothetical protein n=1 Tax=Parachlamydia sp. AcF125 TaxID=2795736 RepID=UPI001BC943A6|nr:hypothetical protein [Parachlamydia sp. AcF125]MBS4167749.1 hypothetical protein [Parachlamydia sp. AcF125]
MDSNKIEQLFLQLEASLEDPRLFQNLFAIVTKIRQHNDAKDGDNLKRVCAEEYEELSRRMDRSSLQESCSARNVLRTRRLANLLINDEGEINFSLISPLMELFKTYLYSLGPHRQYDAKRQEHILHVLSLLLTDKELSLALKSISRPYQHKFADQIIRDTLQLPSNISITDAHARRAALSAWMCYLRQNVGSCFATAPAILVHDEQPKLFLTDLKEILSTGRLKRTFGGIEYSAPLSTSWGAGELRRQFLILRNVAEDFEFWLSPGLLVAFENADIVSAGLSLKSKIQKTKQAVQKILKNYKGNLPYFLISAEDLIYEALLGHLGLTQQDLNDYANRSKGMLYTDLLIQSMPSGGLAKVSKNQACAHFFVKLENARSAFKALTDNALLKSWEFTLASFAETKAHFTRWNLYSSLGFAPEEPGGIGERFYQMIKQKLDECNQAVQDRQTEYEMLFSQVKYLEQRIGRASTEQEVKWMKVEYQSKVNELNVLQELRDEMHAKARQLAQLFNELIEMYDELFPSYFQEVYDADMHDVTTGPYDDSPAGFRLLFKHGRSNTSQWTLIQDQNEFIEALVSFFIATESEIQNNPLASGLERDISEMISAVVGHIRTREFLETAFYRMATAHQTKIVKNPLDHLDKIEKKPWVYTSGGSMSTLVSAYFAREQKPSEVSRWVENPMELLVFLVETLKQLPPKIQDEFEQNSNKSLLMHSPTHAFLLKPGTDRLKEAWRDESYTYIWLRDQFLKPAQAFTEQLLLEEEAVQVLVELIAQKIPPSYRHYFRKACAHLYGRKSVSELRNLIASAFEKDRSLQRGNQPALLPEELDSYLYSWLPLFPREQLEERALEIVNLLPGFSSGILEEIKKAVANLNILTRKSYAYLTAHLLREICKSLICLVTEKTAFPIDYHKEISLVARKLGYATPAPFMFADTNWVKEEFGFVINPGTDKLELWRVDPIGSSGAPMASWDKWLDGSRRDLSWGIYNHPYEYYK